jgi:hypothetical protein
MRETMQSGSERASVQRRGRLERTMLVAAMVFSGANLKSSSRADDAPLPATKSEHELPEALASFGATVSDGWLYVYSGHIGRAHEHSIDNLSRAFRRWNLDDRSQWEDLEMRTPAQSSALVSHRGKVWRIGGMTARNAKGADADLWSLDEVECYDPIARRWEPRIPLPEPRSSHDAVVVGNTIFVVGGWTLAGADKTWLETAWVLDLDVSSLAWKSMPAPPSPRRALSLVAARGKIWALGGMSRVGRMLDRVDVYDLALGTWSEGPTLTGSGFGVAAIALEDRLIANGIDGAVLDLDAKGEAWVRVRTLELPRFFHRLVSTESGKILAIGGAVEKEGAEHLRTIEAILEATPQSPTVPDPQSPTVPSGDSGAASRKTSAIDLRDGSRE